MSAENKPKRYWVVIVVVAAAAALVLGVVALGIILGVAVPAWRNAVTAGNETSAVLTLNTIAVEQRTYFNKNGRRGYGTFEQLVEGGALDARFSADAPVVGGYVFTMSVRPGAGGSPPFFRVNADPLRKDGLGATGKRHFYIDSTLDSVRVNDQRPATATDRPYAFEVRGGS
ncbi:MAG TPA: hypothetical protein VEQ42_02090 [Pyrinomonadaceae bacterium]|nr:hypothetical protein [Pyrinomonadaceae bacterium]